MDANVIKQKGILKISGGPSFGGVESTIGMVGGLFTSILLISGIVGSWGFLPVLFIALLVLFCLVLFIAVRGIMIDWEKRQLFSYFDFFLSKKGDWTMLTGYNMVVIKYAQDNTSLSYKSISTNVVTKSFQLILRSENKPDLLVFEFQSYPEARQLADKMVVTWDLALLDTYEIWKGKLAEYRASRKRR